MPDPTRVDSADEDRNPVVVNLLPSTWRAIDQLQALTGDTTTDCINRAIQHGVQHEQWESRVTLELARLRLAFRNWLPRRRKRNR